MQQAVKRDERILIISDQSLNQSFLRYAFEQLGYKNITLTDKAHIALQLCRQNSYDLLILDYNLSSPKDGYQLFDELKNTNLHKLNCGVIFISAETDPALVHSVLELQPDEFMAKPFVIRELQQRIERVFSRKQLLRPLYNLLEQNAYKTALTYIDKQLGQTEPHKCLPILLKIKGDMLIALNRWDDAKNFFDAMLRIQPFGFAQIGRIKCLLENGEEQIALNELTPLIERQETRLFALDLLSEIEFKQMRHQQAQHYLLNAANIAPRNLVRQQKLLQLSRLNHDYETQYRAARDMVKFARHSMHESPDLYLNMARASIDYALSLDDSEQQSRLNKQASISLNVINKQFSDANLLEQQIVIQARLLYLQEQRDKARQLLLTIKNNNEIHSLEDALDKAKALHEVGLSDASTQLFRKIAAYCQTQQTDPVFSHYLRQEQLEREKMAHGPRELNNNGVQLHQRGNWQEAFSAFAMASQVMPKNAGIALNLYQTLITSPKPLCQIELKEKLMHQCEALIENSTLTEEQQHRYSQLKARQATHVSML